MQLLDISVNKLDIELIKQENDAKTEVTIKSKVSILETQNNTLMDRLKQLKKD